MARKTRCVETVEFDFKKGQCLIVLLESSVGLDRVVIENEGGKVSVLATGHSRFKFGKGKDHNGECDFLLSNPSVRTLMEDVIAGKVWGQFTWGELSKYRDNKRLRRAIERKIKRLVAEFEDKSAIELNRLLKKAGWRRSGNV